MAKKSESAYQRLMEFRADLEQRASVLQVKEREIFDELVDLESGFDEAVIRGDHEAVQEKINVLRTQLVSVQKELHILRNPPKDGHVAKLVREVWDEAVNEISGTLRDRWDAELVDLASAKAIYLAVVGELGRIKAEADSITSRTTECVLFTGAKMGVPSLSTGISEKNKSGPIYLDSYAVEKAFQGRE
jgi:hypothetical protein